MSKAKIIDFRDLVKMDKEVNRFASMFDLIGYDDETELEVRVGVEPDEETDDMIQALVWDECERHKLNPDDIEIELLLLNKNKTYINVIDVPRDKEYRIPFPLTNDEMMSAVYAMMYNKMAALIRIYDLQGSAMGKKPLLSEFRTNHTEDKRDD